MPKKRFSDRDINEMRKMREAGASSVEIAKAFDTSPQIVLTHVGGVDSKSNGKEPRWTSYQKLYSKLGEWTPGEPFKELCLPLWCLRLLGFEDEESKRLREEVEESESQE